MKLCALAIFSFSVSTAAGGGDANKEALKKVEGKWVMVSGEVNGQKLPDNVVQAATLTLAGDKHTVKVGDVTIIGTNKVDITKKPNEIDSMDTAGPNAGKTTLGIMKLEGDQMSVCFAAAGKARPTEFTTKSGTGEIYHAWKRAK